MGTFSDARPAVRWKPRGRARRLRVTREGLETLAFLVPFLVVFGVFAWFPILRGFVMSVQETNLVSEPVFVGLDTDRRTIDQCVDQIVGPLPGVLVADAEPSRRRTALERHRLIVRFPHQPHPAAVNVSLGGESAQILINLPTATFSRRQMSRVARSLRCSFDGAKITP